MAQFGSLRFQILLILNPRQNPLGNPLHDPDLVSFQSRDLARVVGEDPDGRHSLIVKNPGGVFVRSRVGRKTEMEIGLHRIHALVLQGVRENLVGEADAAALLRM